MIARPDLTALWIHQPISTGTGPQLAGHSFISIQVGPMMEASDDFSFTEVLYAMSTFQVPLRRSRSNRMIGGVVAGLAHYLGIDVTLARILYVAISICTVFPGILMYVAFCLIMPTEESSEPHVMATP